VIVGKRIVWFQGSGGDLHCLDGLGDLWVILDTRPEL